MSATRGGIDSRTSKLIDTYNQTLQKFVVQSGVPNPSEVLAMLLKEYIGTDTRTKFFKARTHVEFASKLLAALSDQKTKQSKIIYLIDNYLGKHNLKQSGDFFALLSAYFNYYNSAYPSLRTNIVEQIITPNEQRLLEQRTESFDRLMQQYKAHYKANHNHPNTRDILKYRAIPQKRLDDFFRVMSKYADFYVLYDNFLDNNIEIFSQIYQQADDRLKRKILTYLLGHVSRGKLSLSEFVLKVLSKLDLNNDSLFKGHCAIHFLPDIDNLDHPIVRSIAYRILHMSDLFRSEEKQVRAVTDLIEVCEGYTPGDRVSRIIHIAFGTLAIIPIPSNKYNDLIRVIFEKLAPTSGYPSLLTYPDLFRRVISMLPPDKKASLTKDLINHIDENHLSIDALGRNRKSKSLSSFDSDYTLATEIGIPLEVKTKWVNNFLHIMSSTDGPSANACEKLGLIDIDINAHEELKDVLIKYVGTSLMQDGEYKNADVLSRTLICIALCKSALPDADRENQIDKLLSLLNKNPIKVDLASEYSDALKNACKALGMINIPEKTLPRVVDTLLSVIKNSSGGYAVHLVDRARNSLLALAKEMPVSLRIATMVKLDAMADHSGKGFSLAGFTEKFQQVATERNMATHALDKLFVEKKIPEDVINHVIKPLL